MSANFPNPASVINQYHNFIMPKREWLALGQTISSKSNSTKKRTYVTPRLGNGGIRTPSARNAGTMDRLARLKAKAIGGSAWTSLKVETGGGGGGGPASPGTPT